MTNSRAMGTAEARRAHIEALLASYPDVTPAEHALLVGWFQREATSLDVALVASNPAVARGYQRFRGDHIDRFSLKDLLRAIGVLWVIAAAVLLIVWRAP